ncbi:uncharacterized protein LOC143904958 [Temnothorax americanus]|uniref:uncharacterized protein LOC143904958 n=1 Tax=Temnothorax americanus TaxID=1964332 RepID=UPI004069455E
MEYEESAQYEKDETFLNLLSCRELIGLVRSNELLWKKRCISHKDQQMKSLCWTSIGSALTSVLSGPDAEKEFYKLRQKFGREVRKEKKSAPRSGAGAGQPTYISNWPLYKDLEFLKDVIKPRRTTSNFSKNIIQRPSPSPSPLVAPSNPAILENSPSPGSSLWNSDSENSIFSIESDGDTVSSMSPSSLKRTAPTPDNSYIKKKKIQEIVCSTIEKHSSNIKALTEMVIDRLHPTHKTQQNQPEESLFLSISAALRTVPQEKQLKCVIEVLQVIQKYSMEKENLETQK